MAKLVFDTCCGCIELRTGCLIIGYLQLIGELIIMIMALITLAYGGALTAVNVEEIQGFSAQDTAEINNSLHAAGVIVMVLVGIFLFFLIIGFAFTITLLVGLHKDKRGHIKAYLIYTSIFLVIGLILFFASFASRPIKVANVISSLIGLLLNLYFLLVIRSQYIKLSERKGPAIRTA